MLADIHPTKSSYKRVHTGNIKPRPFWSLTNKPELPATRLNVDNNLGNGGFNSDLVGICCHIARTGFQYYPNLSQANYLLNV